MTWTHHGKTKELSATQTQHSSKITVWYPTNITQYKLYLLSSNSEVASSWSWDFKKATGGKNPSCLQYPNMYELDGKYQAFYNKMISNLSQIRFPKYILNSKFIKGKSGNSISNILTPHTKNEKLPTAALAWTPVA